MLRFPTRESRPCKVFRLISSYVIILSLRESPSNVPRRLSVSCCLISSPKAVVVVFSGISRKAILQCLKRSKENRPIHSRSSLDPRVRDFSIFSSFLLSSPHLLLFAFSSPSTQEYSVLLMSHVVSSSFSISFCRLDTHNLRHMLWRDFRAENWPFCNNDSAGTLRHYCSLTLPIEVG